MVSSDSVMDKHEEALWTKTFKLCGVYAHPEELTKRQREHQKLLLCALHTEENLIGQWAKNKKLALWADWYDKGSSKNK